MMKLSKPVLVLALFCSCALCGCQSKTVGPYTPKGGAQQGGAYGSGGFPEGRITEEMRPGMGGDTWTNPDGPGGFGAGGGSGAGGGGGFGPANEGLDATGGGSLYSGEGGSGRQGRTSAGMTPVFFDYDSSVIRADQIPAVEGNAAFLKSGGRNVLIEGNTDYRGTKEYNLALGERRANSARSYLIELGVPESRIRTISYGEERPLMPGDSESDYALNRRADFVLE